MRSNLDSWLRLRFGTRWVVSMSASTVCLPAKYRVRTVRSPGILSREVVANTDDDYHELVARLRAARKMYDVRIEAKQGFLASLVNREGSLSMSAAWATCYASVAVGAVAMLLKGGMLG